jgi:2-polyprenyl-3-methyl-5-hydroxy-6-metoxy-1,4-benzoquinol methylase
MTCPLCRSSRVAPFAEVGHRRYLDCAVCRLISLVPEHRLDRIAERACYDTHENDPRDPRYRGFLNQLAAPLVEHLPAGARGLDYGSGPGPTLSVMLAEQGFEMTIYDPCFAPDAAALRRSYDFITCTETAEHFFAPGDELDRLGRMLRPGGWLAIMTELWRDDRAFADWRYPRDPTHVCFYRPATMQWIADHHGWALESPHANVALFHAGATPQLPDGDPELP